VPSSGTELAIVNLTIENSGYEAFETSKTYFSAVVNGVAYKYDSTCYANDLLPDTKIADGGIAKGNVTFTLPAATLGSDIALQYTGPGTYEISWVKNGMQ
jgi:hypothetical protein